MKFKSTAFINVLVLLSVFHVKGQEIDTAKIPYRKPLFDFDYQKQLFKLEDEQLTNHNRWLRYSALSGYREGVDQVTGLANFNSYGDKSNGTRKIYMYNLSIQDMLTHGFYKSNYVILEVKDSSKYRYDPSQGNELEWKRKNAHCFELLLPDGLQNGAKILDNELAHVFRVKAGTQKRLVDVLVLVRISDKDKIESKGSGQSNYNDNGYFNNVPLSYLVSILNNEESLPVVDETGYKSNVDMSLKINSWQNLTALRKSLRQYDLDLKNEKREMDMYVITETK